MKVKVTRKEIRECVEKAVLRVVKEGKSLRKFKDDDSFGDKRAPKHGKLDKKGFAPREKGNKGNRDWSQWEEDDEV